MNRIFGALVVATVLACGPVSAQDYQMHMTDGVSGAPGDTVTIACLLDVSPTADVLAGWSQGICHDPAEVDPVTVVSGSTTQTSNNGAPPGFEQLGITDTGGGIGVTQGVVINLLGLATLPGGTNYETLVIEYDLLGPDGTIAAIDYCDTAGDPAVETVVVPSSGASVVPAKQGTLITIEVVPLLLTFGTVAPIAQGESVDVPVLLTSSTDVFGFQLGVLHDPGAMTPIAVEQGLALSILNGGSGPDFFLESLDPEGGSGITIGCLFSTTNVTEVLGSGTDQELALVTYQASPAAPLGDTAILFTDILSPGAPAPAVQTLISTGEDTEVPLQSPGTITIEVGGALFVRGDLTGNADVDISDPVTLLGYLFSGDAEPPCLDAGDFDNSGGLDVGDAVNILTYLFGGGPSPAAPFPDCGIDPEGDSDGVTCVSSATGC